MKKSMTCLILAAMSVAAGQVEATLQFQSEQSQYVVSANGTVKADVRIYLAETDGTTLADEGGLNSVKFVVAANNPPAIPPTLQAITNMENFEFYSPQLATGSLYEQYNTLDGGTGVDAQGRVYLGTFTYVGGLGVQTTTFQISDAPTDDIFTAKNGLQLDGQIGTGSFIIAVPEPTTALALLGCSALLYRRPARRQPQ